MNILSLIGQLHFSHIVSAGLMDLSLIILSSIMCPTPPQPLHPFFPPPHHTILNGWRVEGMPKVES